MCCPREKQDGRTDGGPDGRTDSLEWDADVNKHTGLDRTLMCCLCVNASPYNASLSAHSCHACACVCLGCALR